MLVENNTRLDEDCDCPEEELLMMKTRKVVQDREETLLINQKNVSLCQEYASHLEMGGGGGGPEDLGGEVF